MPDITVKIDPFIKHINEALASLIARDEPVVARVGEYSFEGGGKRLRPVIFCLVSEALGREPTPALFETSAAFEFLHMATLLHDDIIDGARLRRGREAAHLVFGVPETVLAGDYLLAKAAQLGAETYNLDCVKALSSIVAAMSLGELIQLEMRHNPDISEADYFNIIYSKTAILMEGAAQSAAFLAEAEQSHIAATREYGKKFGLAFQIMDDVLDYQSDEEHFGKPVGHDLVEGKITLPFILARDALTGSERERLCHLGANFVPEDWPEVQRLVAEGEGLKKAVNAALSLAREAEEAIAALPPSQARDSLTELARYVVARDH